MPPRGTSGTPRRRKPKPAPDLRKITGGFVPKVPSENSKRQREVPVSKVGPAKRTPLGPKKKAPVLPKKYRAMGPPISPSLVDKLLSNTFSEAAQIAKGLPAFGYTLGKATGHDIYNASLIPGLGDERPALYEDIGKPLADYYKQRYGQGPGHIASEFVEHPLTGVLDVTGLAGLAGRTGSIGAGISRGASPRRAVRESYYPAKDRTATYRGETVPLRQSRHPTVRWAEGIYDTWVAREEHRRVLPDLAGRVAKAKSTQIRRETRRTGARGANLGAQVHRISFQPLQNKNLRVRAYWEAQLPPELRGGPGLKMLRDDLASEKGAATTRRSRRQLNRRIGEIDAALKAKPDKRYDDALGAMETLGSQRQEILEMVFGDRFPELEHTFGARQGLLARRLGEEGQGTYVPHVGKPIKRGATQAPEPRPPDSGVFGQASTQGTRLTQKNELRRYASGELLADPDLVIQGWLKAQTLKVQYDIKQFFSRIGKPIHPEEGPLPGHYVVNPQGKPLPQTWKEAEVTDEAMGPLLEEYVHSWLADEKSATRMQNEAGWEGLVQVPNEVVHKFYSQWGGPKAAFGASPASQTFDVVNGIVRLSLLYLNPAYVPGNFAGNAAFGVLHQGPAHLVRNLAAAGKIASKDRNLWRKILAEVGHSGATVSLAAETRTGRQFTRKAKAVERRIAGGVGSVADNLPRAAAWLYEARQAGYRSREQMLSLLDDESLRGKLNDVSSRAEEAMVNFDRLAPWERDILGKVAFVWPWIRGATAWPGYYAKNYPERAALIAPQAEAAQAENDNVLGALPNYLAGAIPLEVVGDIAKIRPTQAFSPTMTALGSMEAIGGIVSGHPERGRELGSYVNPLIEGAYTVAQAKNQYGQSVGYPEAAKELGRTLSPIARLTQELVEGPSDTGLYRDEDRVATALRRVLRGSPARISLKEAHRLAGTGKKLSGPQKDFAANLTKLRSGTRWLLAKPGIDKPTVRKIAREAESDLRWILNYRERVDKEKQEKGEPLSETERLEILLPFAIARRPDKEREFRSLAGKATDDFLARRAHAAIYAYVTPAYSKLTDVVPGELERKHMAAIARG